MANAFTKKLKTVGRYIWTLFKSSILPIIMYSCAGMILMMLTMRGESIEWSATNIAWAVVCILGGAAYQALVSYANGGSQYEMLVSGNVTRSRMDEYGNFKMSSHKQFKEYRPWKGFAIGGFVALFPILFGIIFGCNQAAIHSESISKGLGVLLLISFFLSGWSIIPFYCMNAAGISASYFLSTLFAIIPIAVSGGMYIAGAYGRRNKTLREQLLKEKAAQEEEAKRANRKINYGALPGTKPRKRK